MAWWSPPKPPTGPPLPATVKGPVSVLAALLGADSPETQAISAVNPIAGVTAFLTRGLPNVAARSRATTQALQQLATVLSKIKLPPAVREAILGEAQRTPRVMAHQRTITAAPLPDYGRQVVMGMNTPGTIGPWGQKLSGTKLNYRVGADPSGQDAAETFFHELGHGAQRIFRQDKMNQPMQQAISGLDDLELGAEAVGRKRWQRIKGQLYPPSSP